MNHKTKLQMRMSNNHPRHGYHKVYQVQIPIALIRKLGWRKGNHIIMRSRSNQSTIVLKKEPKKWWGKIWGE